MTSRSRLWMKRFAAPALLAVTGIAALALTTARAARLGGLSLAVHQAETSHPSALWHVVHDLCVTDMATRGHAAPCAAVNLGAGFAVVHDPAHPTQLLLVPTARLSGIESPALQTQGSPNYWQAAWSARSLLERQVGRPLPREDVGLAINSVSSRTQDQLHIHIDCVRPDVQAVLRAHAGAIGPHWMTLSPALLGRPYRVRWIAGAELGHADPFKLLARSDPKARANMGAEGLFLVGASRGGRPGFILLSHRDDLARGEIGAAEELLDHQCRVLSQPVAQPS